MKSTYKARWGNDRKRKAKHSRRLARQQRAAERLEVAQKRHAEYLDEWDALARRVAAEYQQLNY